MRLDYNENKRYFYDAEGDFEIHPGVGPKGTSFEITGTPSGGIGGGGGPPGKAATIEVGTVTTLEPGSQATVDNVGTTSAAKLNFGIPRGEDGKDSQGGGIDFSGLQVVPIEQVITNGLLAVNVPGVDTFAVRLSSLRGNIVPELFTVTVTGGIGSDDYAVGDTVTIEWQNQAVATFAGWVVESGGVALDDDGAQITTFVMPANAVSIRAAERVTVSFNSNGGVPSNNSPVTLDRGAALGNSLPAVSQDGYTFNGWFDGNTQYEANTPIMGNVTLVAGWRSNAPQVGDTDTFTDARDGKTYRTVFMPDGKWWMAENLNYVTPSGSWEYGNDPAKGVLYGRLYDWNTAMVVAPPGWHLPTRQEWGDLAIAVGGTGPYGETGLAGQKLKSNNGWDENGNGTDDYGFSALPGGQRTSSTGNFRFAGSNGYWWTATVGGMSDAYSREMRNTLERLNEISNARGLGCSVRLVKDV